jgi:hypothetical protein
MIRASRLILAAFRRESGYREIAGTAEGNGV